MLYLDAAGRDAGVQPGIEVSEVPDGTKHLLGTARCCRFGVYVSGRGEKEIPEKISSKAPKTWTHQLAIAVTRRSVMICERHLDGLVRAFSSRSLRSIIIFAFNTEGAISQFHRKESIR
jgi:hypothetical protein